MKIATWNVNSLRVRLPQLLSWLALAQPDVVALQETKVTDADFPESALRDAGYLAAFSGQKTYNGVAVLSRWPLQDIVTDPPNLIDPQRRVLAVTTGAIRIVDLYVPNGSEVGSDKYAYKLDWLEKIADYLAEQLKVHADLVVLGDFNIAPEDRDVHDPDAWREKVLCSSAERRAFSRLLDLGLVDAFRSIEQSDGLYTWWDYRAAAFRRNLGLRIDHLLVSRPLSERVADCRIDLAPRKLERPSDHTPVWLSIADED